MWNWLRRITGEHTLPPSGSRLAFDDLKPRIEQLLELDLSSEDTRTTHGDEVLSTLQDLDADIERVREMANGYPRGPISADVWMTGAGYGDLCAALTQHFAESGWLEHETNASALWAKATLAVNAHYHHLVGPAMNANADCHLRLGEIERATDLWSGVVRDFLFLLDDFDDNDDGPYDEERIALESLRDAIAGIRGAGHQTLDEIDLIELQRKVESVLHRPTPDD